MDTCSISQCSPFFLSCIISSEKIYRRQLLLFNATIVVSHCCFYGSLRKVQPIDSLDVSANVFWTVHRESQILLMNCSKVSFCRDRVHCLPSQLGLGCWSPLVIVKPFMTRWLSLILERTPLSFVLCSLEWAAVVCSNWLPKHEVPWTGQSKWEPLPHRPLGGVFTCPRFSKLTRLTAALWGVCIWDCVGNGGT